MLQKGKMLKVQLYNSLSGRLEEVKPSEDSLVRIYACGPTVYDYPHIGNLRKYIFDDLLHRTLLFAGYKVKQVINITDVGHLTSDADTGEDKIEKGAQREGKSAREIAKFYEEAFWADLKKLNILAPGVAPRASDHIKEQIALVKILEEKGLTYKTADGIYFDTAKLASYGRLGGINVMGQLEGVRMEKNPQKHHSADFALWKFTPNGVRRQMEWPSPWGVGFPGWHLECSAMSHKYLGQSFEIHTGGVDHLAVHHNNEIAQSEAAYGAVPARIWLHSEFVLQDSAKMAKSAGHFIRLRDLEKQGFDPLDFRCLCLLTHYRSKLNFTVEALKNARNVRLGWKNCICEINDKEGEEKFFAEALEEIAKEMATDLDTPKALAILSKTLGSSHRGCKRFLQKIDELFGLDLAAKKVIPGEVRELVAKREKLREGGRFDEADKVREEIANLGWAVEDRKDKTIVAEK